MQSFKKKIVSLINNGIDPLEEGIRNFKKQDLDVELLALERLETCKGCEFFNREPISFLRVIDENIPSLSEMFCEECGCTSSYKLRQSIKKCVKWVE